MTQCSCSHIERDHFRGGACRECDCLIFDPWEGELPVKVRVPEAQMVTPEIVIAPPEPREGEWWENA